jgi:hypothetical protein
LICAQVWTRRRLGDYENDYEKPEAQDSTKKCFMIAKKIRVNFEIDPLTGDKYGCMSCDPTIGKPTDNCPTQKKCPQTEEDASQPVQKSLARAPEGRHGVPRAGLRRAAAAPRSSSAACAACSGPTRPRDSGRRRAWSRAASPSSTALAAACPARAAVVSAMSPRLKSWIHAIDATPARRRLTGWFAHRKPCDKMDCQTYVDQLYEYCRGKKGFLFFVPTQKPKTLPEGFFYDPEDTITGTWNDEVEQAIKIAVEKCGCNGAAGSRASLFLAVLVAAVGVLLA